MVVRFIGPPLAACLIGFSGATSFARDHCLQRRSARMLARGRQCFAQPLVSPRGVHSWVPVMSCLFEGMNEHVVFGNEHALSLHEGQVPAEIETLLFSIRCSLGVDSFHTATRSRRAEPARNMRFPFCPTRSLQCFKCVQQEKHHSVCLRFLGFAPRVISALHHLGRHVWHLRHWLRWRVALCTTGRVSDTWRGQRSASVRRYQPHRRHHVRHQTFMTFIEARPL